MYALCINSMHPLLCVTGTITFLQAIAACVPLLTCTLPHLPASRDVLSYLASTTEHSLRSFHHNVPAVLAAFLQCLALHACPMFTLQAVFHSLAFISPRFKRSLAHGTAAHESPQEDVAEVLTMFFDAMHDPQHHPSSARLPHRPIVLPVTGQYRTRVVCTVCQHATSSSVPFHVLTVAIPSGPATLFSCIQAVNLPQPMPHYSCTACQVQYEALPCCSIHLQVFIITVFHVSQSPCNEVASISKWPEVLCIQLMRFTASREKLSSVISAPHVMFKPHPTAPTYDLHAVINHHGPTIHSGTPLLHDDGTS